MKREKLISSLLFFCAFISVLVVFLIFGFTFFEGLPVFAKYGLDFLFGLEWRPYDEPPKFGLLPTIIGSFSVAILCLAISVPIGILTAIYLAEYSRGTLRNFIKSAAEFLVSIPSVLLGFIGLIILVPLIREYLGGWGFSILAGGIVLAIMTLPHIVSISEDAIRAVPREYRMASLALGASRWQTVRNVVLPYARSGIIASVILGLCNAIGETMAVLMVIGNPEIPFIPSSILDRVRVLTSTIVIEFDYAIWGSEQMRALFAVGVVLFVITMALNIAAIKILRRGLHARVKSA
ncbi:MAG: phosphate ABC transporter permease subunit PstC [Nitrososphaerota archaeon]|nr:phosphate ABC transporter permease subunit PstC [Nitrososphaerota archaeon]